MRFLFWSQHCQCNGELLAQPCTMLHTIESASEGVGRANTYIRHWHSTEFPGQHDGERREGALPASPGMPPAVGVDTQASGEGYTGADA